MSWIGSTFDRIFGRKRCETERNTGDGEAFGIAMDNDLNDLADGINACLPISGAKPLTGPLNANGFPINNVKPQRDLDLNGYKIINFGSNENEPYGKLCEKMEEIPIIPCIGDKAGVEASAALINKKSGMFQVIGDIVFFTGIIRVTNTASPQTLGLGTYINLSNGMQLPPFVIDAEIVNDYFYPVEVQEIVANPADRVVYNARIIKSTTGNKTLIELLDVNFNPIDNYIIDGQTLKFSGWYKIAKDTFIVSDTPANAGTGGNGPISEPTTFNNAVVFNSTSEFNDDVTMTTSLTVPDINGRDPVVDGAKLDSILPNNFSGMSMTSISLQTAAVINTGYPVTINNIHVDGGLTHGALPASAFTIIENGVYELCFQPWMKGGAGNLMEFWWEVDTGGGFTTIAESVTQTENHSVIEQRKFCKVVTRLNAGDIVRAMWATGSTAMQINTYASIVGAAVPTVQMDIVRLAE